MDQKYLDYEGLQELVIKIRSLVDNIGHLVLKGTSASVAALPALADVQNGWMYIITAAGTTTSDFIEGARIEFAANSEVVKVTSGSTAKWALLGSIFNVDDRLQFGAAMPVSPVINQVFLYLGDTTYSYSQVTPKVRKTLRHWAGITRQTAASRGVLLQRLLRRQLHISTLQEVRSMYRE